MGETKYKQSNCSQLIWQLLPVSQSQCRGVLFYLVQGAEKSFYCRTDVNLGSVWCVDESVQCAVCSVKCEVCSVQCVVYIMQCAVCSVQCEVWSVYCGVYSAGQSRWIAMTMLACLLTVWMICEKTLEHSSGRITEAAHMKKLKRHLSFDNFVITILPWELKPKSCCTSVR